MQPTEQEKDSEIIFSDWTFCTALVEFSTLSSLHSSPTFCRPIEPSPIIEIGNISNRNRQITLNVPCVLPYSILYCMLPIIVDRWHHCNIAQLYCQHYWILFCFYITRVEIPTCLEVVPAQAAHPFCKGMVGLQEALIDTCVLTMFVWAPRIRTRKD